MYNWLIGDKPEKTQDKTEQSGTKQNKAEQSRGYLTDRRESYKSYKSYKDCKTVKIKYPTNTKEQEVWEKHFLLLVC